MKQSLSAQSDEYLGIKTRAGLGIFMIGQICKQKMVCHSEPRLTFSLKDQVYFLTLHTVFYQHELNGGDDNYKMPPIQLIDLSSRADS
ncbi:hypothetical protein PEC730217_22550 [Pectobacterium carotovorum subsp. carotovorum]|nr:hypothetical protein PEC730217_22550 [Pectobacterium carotovorum subsp. carotovorum]